MFPIICVLNHEQISWVSIEIYYHDNFVFGHIFMFLTSIFAHFCVLCTYLVGKQQEAHKESNHGMLFICLHVLWSLTSPYAGLRTPFGLAHEGLQNWSQDHGPTWAVCGAHIRRGFEGKVGMYMGIDPWFLFSMNTRLRFHACFEPWDHW